MRIVMAGTSGFLGRHLVLRLAGEGHHIVKLVRREATAVDEVRWDPYAGRLDPAVLDGAGAVVNLGGAPIAGKRWNAEYKQRIHDSRTIATTVLAEAVAAANVPSMVNASAVGWYGDTADLPVDESAPAADDFLGRTCRDWEAATAPASAAGARVAMLRTGHVLAGDSEMIKRLWPVFTFGIGGRFGSGRQQFCWISLPDWLAAAQYVIEHDVRGPVNLVGPSPATNAEFTRAFGHALRRPTPFVVPASALKLAVGEAATELLRGAKVIPKVLQDNGFEFRHHTVGEAMEWAVNSR
jgi:uncharacterized protein (TIGR01777 family)